jgi:hypothetical protein
VIRRVREVLDAGAEVWFGDETSLREFPPFRAAWSRVGKQAEVSSSQREERSQDGGGVSQRAHS